ncbi:MAG TPA: hypothetical protein VFZ78_09085 [Flavisolibacter sp.]
MKRFFILTLVSLLLCRAHAQQVTVTADKKSILIGEQLTLKLEAKFPQGKELPGWFVIDSIPHFEILRVTELDSQVVDGMLVKSQTLTLTSWDSGRWLIPPYVFPGGKTRAVPVIVRFSPMDPNQPYHDVKDIMNIQVPRDSSSWWWYVVGALLLIAILMLIFSGKQKDGAPAVTEDPYRQALKRMTKLDPRDTPQVYYTELVNIYRDYLSGRKNIQSYSKTTGDLATRIRQLQMPAEHYDQLVTVLQRSDLVKYARYQPGKGENEESYDVIRKNIMLIEQTK